MIRFQNITKVYPPNTVALEGVSFEVKKGEFVSLVGKSGAGKTTLLRLLLAEEVPTEGEVLFEEQNVHMIPFDELPYFRRKIGVVFQDYKLLRSKNAFENIAFVMEAMGVEDEVIKREAADVLAIVGLEERANNFPDQLSGGEKQRLAIARAFVHRPDVVVADEPTGNLDPYNTREIIRLLVKINSLGTTTILATHNKDVVNQLGKRVITLDQGKLVRDEERGKFMI
ncbi:MAG: cell division ATP-binding protein FtsE [bacterium]|nr:cell division ATP-binding protein FtsE [Candidatus Wildermuthbacteria bacterium]MDP2664468.1 cell division ATP-binding protein FtsE [bacterium]